MSRDVVLFVESNTTGTGRLFVQAARALGLRPVLITARPDRYAYLTQPDAPDVLLVPAVNEAELYPRLRARFDGGEAIAGITSSSEYFMATAAALAARFGLPGPDAACVRTARDKSWQREAMAAAGLPTPAFRVVTSASEAIRAARAIGLPVIVKPLRGSGSVGVQACASAPEAGSHAASLLAEQPAGEAPGVLVESLIDGPEFSVEVFSGRIVGITRKHLGAPPHFVEIGHDYPADIDDDDARGLLHVVRRATGVLGLGWGPLHWELRVREGRAYAMEVNPRLAGGFIPELVRLAHGTDLIRNTLKLVVGQRVDLSPTRGRHASIRFLLAPRGGRFAAVDGVAQARALDHVSSAMLYRTVGDMLSRNGDFRDRIGHVIADADGAQAAAAAAELGRDAIRVSVIDQTITDDVDDAVLPLVGVGL